MVLITFWLLAGLSGSVHVYAAVTAVSACSMVQTAQHCIADQTEYKIQGVTQTANLPASYTDCHPHATETWCMGPDRGEVQIVLATPTSAPNITAVTDCRLDHQTEV